MAIAAALDEFNKQLEELETLQNQIGLAILDPKGKIIKLSGDFNLTPSFPQSEQQNKNKESGQLTIEDFPDTDLNDLFHTLQDSRWLLPGKALKKIQIKFEKFDYVVALVKDKVIMVKLIPKE